MLAALRSNTKAILWIVVVAFLGFTFAVWGKGVQRSRSGPSKGVIGRVGAASVRYQDYADARGSNLKAYADQAGAQVTDEIRAAIEDQTWQALVQQALIDQEIERLGINVSDQHVFEILWNNPPDVVLRSPAFQKENGQFDFDLYHREIQLHPERWEGVAEYYRRVLKEQVLQQEIQAAAFVNENEVWSEYITRNQKVAVSYVVVDPASVPLDDVMPSDDEARAYFAQHKAEYERPPMASLVFVRFPRTPTRDDEQDVIARLEDIADAVRDGEAFGDLAKVYSEDPTAQAGGDLGTMRGDAMPPGFAEATQALAVGQVSQPFRTDAGYYIVQVEDRRRAGGETEVRLRGILMRVRASEQTLAAIEDAAVQLLTRAKSAGLAQAADSLGLRADRTPRFPEGRNVPGIGSAPTAVALAFQERAGFLFGPMTTNDAVYAFEVAEKTKKGVPTYDELEAEAKATGGVNPVKLALAARRQGERALAIATEIAGAVRSGRTLEEAAAQYGTTVRQTAPFSRRDFVPGVGRGNEAIGASFSLPVGTVTGPVKTESPERYFVIQADEQIAASQDGFQAQRVEIGNQLLQRRRQELLSAWMDGLTRRTKIEDYRDIYFASGGREQQPPSVGYGY